MSEAGGALHELGRLSQWVLWRYETRDNKRTKVPYAAPGRKAAVDNPHSWTTYDRAQAAAAEFDGLGFVFTGTAYCGIDLDHCVDDAGTVEAWAHAIVQRFNSYTERSPSGRGLHIWIRGHLPGEQRGRQRKGLGPARAGGVELYSTGRYFTITGDHLPETPATIHARQSELDRFFDEMFPPPPVPAVRPLELGRAEGMLLTDRYLLDKATRAKNGEVFLRLWTGDWSGYGSQSEADLALCAHLAFWTGRDPGRVDRLFRASGLMREKWDARRGGDTYGALTIARALESASGGYNPGVRPATGASGPVNAGAAIVAGHTEITTEIAMEPETEAIVADREADEPEWFEPKMGAEAFTGLAGRIVEIIEPYSEASPVAILLHVLVGLGSIIGRGPHALVEKTSHHVNEFVALVGRSSKGRKGQAWSVPRWLLTQADEVWAAARVISGLSSGEGLIYNVRDPRDEEQPIKEKGRVAGYETVRVDAGVDDKRLLVFEPELASVLRRMEMDSNSLSAVLRQAWDEGRLATVTKNSPLRATGAHVSLIAHVTLDELAVTLTQTERANGFANRFLFHLVERSKVLPEGGEPPEVALWPLVEETRRVVDHARRVGRIQRDDEARALWAAVYPQLSDGKPGLLGAVTARAEAHVLRVSILYALLDGASAVSRQHLLAALAVWDHAAASAERIFGDRTGLSVADTILEALRRRGPMTQDELRNLFHRNKPAAELDAALRLLVHQGKVRQTLRPPAGGRGRPATVWEVV